MSRVLPSKEKSVCFEECYVRCDDDGWITEGVVVNFPSREMWW